MDECFQGGHELARAPCLELAFELCLERGQAQFFEAGELCPGEGLVGELGQGRPAPELERWAGLPAASRSSKRVRSSSSGPVLSR